MNLVGQTLGQYQLTEIIHQGENTVYKGFQPSMNRTVAVKILAPAQSNNPAFVQQFQRDMQLIINLKHPNILPVYDYGQQDGLLYIVSEYEPGGILQDRLAYFQMPHQAQQMINAIGGALEYLHSNNTVHGNLKPSNVLINAQGQPLLTDFGYTQGIDVTPEESVYLSPELAQGGQFDQRADIYALGVLLYEMLVGSSPPIGAVPDPAAMRPDLPAGLDQVIINSMAQYPDQRYQTVGEFTAALDQCLGGTTTAAAPESKSTTRIWLWGGIIVALLALVACGLLFVFGFLFGIEEGESVASGTPVGGGIIIVVPTPKPGEPYVMASTNVNIRTGPGTEYTQIGILPAGASAVVVGKNADSTWWAINIPPDAVKTSSANLEQDSFRLSALAHGKIKPRGLNSYNGNGWVSGDFVEAFNTENVPVLVPPPVPTPTPAPPVTFEGWKGEYFNNPDLQGQPVLVRDDPKIDFNWGTGSPAPEVPADNFSVRWTLTRDLPAGLYRFSIWVDDGARLYVDDTLVINGWDEAPPRNLFSQLYLNQGTHTVRVEYFEAAGEALISLGVGYSEQPPQPQPPTAAINGSTQVQVGQPAYFNARNSSVAEGSHITTFAWDFGDGGTASGVDVAHVYNQAGTYEVSLTVTDDKKLSDTDTLSINVVASPVEPSAPVAVIAGPNQAQVGDTVVFDGSQSQCETTCVSYAWDLGDGTVANAVSIQHVYQSANTYNVVLVVTDDRGLEGRTNHQIVVGNAPGPTATNTAVPEATNTPVPEATDTSVPEATPTSVPTPPAASFNYDPLNPVVSQAVEFDGSSSQAGSGAIVSYNWDFGDGTTGSGPTIQHTYAATGNYTVVLTVADDLGNNNSFTQPVQVSAAQPAPQPLPANTTTPGTNN